MQLKFNIGLYKGEPMKHLLYNALRTPDGTILESRSRHDYIEYKDKVSGEIYILDGGLEYQRMSINEAPAENLAVYTSDLHCKIREVFTWGTYGRDGLQPKKYVLLKDLTDEHLAAILRTQTHLPAEMQKVFRDEILFRDLNDCNVTKEGY